MTSKSIIREVEALGWQVRDCQYPGGDVVYQAFFRGFQTEWRATLAEVLKDVQKIREPEIRTI